ncbi:hypothetical protein D3C73_966360 [compost metagenome]
MEGEILIALLRPFFLGHIPGNNIDPRHLPVDHNRSNDDAEINLLAVGVPNRRLVTHLLPGKGVTKALTDDFLICSSSDRQN